MPDNNQGMTFDSAPVGKDTPVPSNASGMIFDSAPVSQDTPASGQQSPQPSAVSRYFSNLYDNTLGGLVGMAKSLQTYYDNKSTLSKVLDLAGGPAQLLVDAAVDPSHPLNQMGHAAVKQALQHAETAYHANQNAATSAKMALQQLARGNFNQAGALGEAALENEFEEIRNTAAAVPLIGPASAKAGKQIASGDVAGGLGAATGLVGTVIAPSLIKGAASGTAGAVNAAKNAVTDTASLEAVQPEMQEATTSAAKSATDSANVAPVASQSVRDLFNDAAEPVFAKSKSFYSQIDAATDNAWQRNQNALKAISQTIRTATDEEKLTDAFARQKDLLSEQDDIAKLAIENGVDKDAVSTAKSTYRQASALEDLQAQVNMTVTGRTGVTAANETISPAKLLPRLNKMYDAGRLQDALGGPDEAQKFIQSVEAAGGKRAVSASKIFAAAKNVGIGAGAIGATAYGINKVLSGSSH